MSALSQKFTYNRDYLNSGEFYKYACVEGGTASFSACYPNTTIYEEDFDGSDRVVKATCLEPTRGQITTTAGKVYYGTRNTFFVNTNIPALNNATSNNHHAMIPFSLSGTGFSLSNTRNSPRQYFVYPLGTGATVEFRQGISIASAATSTTSMTAGVVNTALSQSSNNQRAHILSDQPILISSRGNISSSNYVDTLLMPPCDFTIYFPGIGSTYKHAHHHGTNSLDNAGVWTSKYVFNFLKPDGTSDYVIPDNNAPKNIGQITEVGDGAGSEAIQGISEKLMSTSFTLSEQLQNYTIIAPHPSTKVELYYRSNGDWIKFKVHEMNGSLQAPARVFQNPEGNTAKNNTSSFISTSTNQWRWESNNPIGLWVNEGGGEDELQLIGWNRKQLSPSIGSSLSFESSNSSWYGSNYKVHVMPQGLNNITMKAAIKFQTNRDMTKKLVEKIQNSTSGPMTGQAAFSGMGSHFDFGGAGDSPLVVNLDNDLYNNFRGSSIVDYNIKNISKDVFETNINLVNNVVSPIMHTGMGFVSNKLVAPTSTTKKKFDVFFEDTNANSNKFDNFYYMSQDDDNTFGTFERATNSSAGSFASFHSTPTTLKCSASASPGGDGTVRAVSSLPKKIEVETANYAVVTLRCFVDDITTSNGIEFKPTNSIGNNGYGAYNGTNHQKNGVDLGGLPTFVQDDKGKFVTMKFKGDNLEANHHLGSAIIVLGASELIELSQISISYELNTYAGDLSSDGHNLKGVSTYEGFGVSPSNFNLHATRTFFFTPDLQTPISIDHSNRTLDFKGSFNQYLNISKNQNSLTKLGLTFFNRSDQEAYAILHFLETHLGYKTFVYKFDDPIISQDRVFYCDNWSHVINYKGSNTIKATFTEVAQPVTPNF